jgi:hypothetical protein
MKAFTMNDLLLIVFPDFFSPNNQDAAVQFCIDAVIHNKQLALLPRLLDLKSNLGEIGGDPGWTIERRKPIFAQDSYASWPSWAAFRTFLDPDSYYVPHPECYSSEETFLIYLKKLLLAYGLDHPDILLEIPGFL